MSAANKDRPKAGVKKKPLNPDKLLAIVSTPAEPITPTTISQLRPAGYNPRVITISQQKMLQASMKEYGDLSGIIFNVKTGRLVGGHQRVKQLDPSWPIIKEEMADNTGTVATGYIDCPDGRISYREVAWTEAKEKGGNVAANKMGGMFDDELLAQLLQELSDGGYDMDLTGFDADELEELLDSGKEDPLGEEDVEVEEVETPFVLLGDMWVLGESRLLCGDSTSLIDVDKLLMGEKAHCCWMDPPYGISYETKAGKIENDNLNKEEFHKFLLAIYSTMLHALKPGACFYVAHASSGQVGDAFTRAMAETKGLYNAQTLAWVKNAATLCRSDYNHRFEPILYGWVLGAGHYFCGDFSLTTVIDFDTDLAKLDKKQLLELLNEKRNAEPTNVIRIDKPSKSVIHPTIKPIRLIERNIRSSTRQGEIVIDLFSGSGSTIIACRKTGRKGRAMELSPGYIQASLKRYQDYCGEEPQLVGKKGEMIPYSEVEKQRKKPSK